MAKWQQSEMSMSLIFKNSVSKKKNNKQATPVYCDSNLKPVILKLIILVMYVLIQRNVSPHCDV